MASTQKKTTKKKKAPPKPEPPAYNGLARLIGGVVCLLLALCVLVSYFQVDALLLTFIAKVLKGTLGYGYFLAAPALLAVAVIQLRHQGRPVILRTTCTLLVPLLSGMLCHLLLCAAVYDFSAGFCVAGSNTAAFLEDALEQLGLSRAEANEFIIYWLPRMQENAYNLIAFQHEAYTESARLTITPEPDTLIRVFMAYRPLEKAVEIAPQTLTAPERTGFTAVEWGGAECK